MTRRKDFQASRARIEEFVGRLPKVELHLHFEGAFRWETVRELHPEGSQLPAKPPWVDRGRFADFEEFRSAFRQYLMPTARTPDAVERHMREVLSDLEAQHVRYVELNVCMDVYHPVPVDELVDALRRGRDSVSRRGRLRVHFILGLSRLDPPERVREQAEEMLAIRDVDGSGFFSGIDLQNDERFGPAADFADVYEYARQCQVRVKAHAGEFRGPASVRDAVECLGVRHICHGVRAIEDLQLVKELARRGIYLHMCPTSNIFLGAVSQYTQHPIRSFLRAGCFVTVNSDDPTLFGTTLTLEYLRLAQHLSFSIPELATLAKNAVQGSLLDDSSKEEMLDRIRQMVTVYT